MSQFRVYIAQSVDGYIATADGGVAWLDDYQGGDDYEFSEFIAAVDTVVMGRKTYEQMLGFGDWPYTGKRTIVLTGQEGIATPLGDVETFTGDINILADRLERESVGDIWLLGGATAIQAFLAAGRVDRIELYTMPELLGSGVRMFPEGGPEMHLELIEHKPFPCGVMRTVYVPGRNG